MQLTFRQPLLITLMLCAVSLTAQEYRYELGLSLIHISEPTRPY